MGIKQHIGTGSRQCKIETNRARCTLAGALLTWHDDDVSMLLDLPLQQLHRSPHVCLCAWLRQNEAHMHVGQVVLGVLHPGLADDVALGLGLQAGRGTGQGRAGQAGAGDASDSCRDAADRQIRGTSSSGRRAAAVVLVGQAERVCISQQAHICGAAARGDADEEADVALRALRREAHAAATAAARLPLLAVTAAAAAAGAAGGLPRRLRR